eukprot:CAMPEP_0198207150 /NCGR_PEP_ID=MMETSP1445-20131203/10632_1 /TAXON_ID=36898 /ORGANISM="Pyramimonas sp., Strain CCMP2087" /LENGTH=105 /DNA_ID=CAMNT_0043880087 /DNA_START=98 /DNA_END=415 /DNA_ORIENTATION=-
MGREEAKEQAKGAQKEKEEVNRARNQERKDKVWAKGTNEKAAAKSAEQLAKDAEKATAQAAKKAQELAEGGGSSSGGAVNQARPGFKKCKECSTKHDPKKGCPLP